MRLFSCVVSLVREYCCISVPMSTATQKISQTLPHTPIIVQLGAFLGLSDKSTIQRGKRARSVFVGQPQFVGQLSDKFPLQKHLALTGIQLQSRIKNTPKNKTRGGRKPSSCWCDVSVREVGSHIIVSIHAPREECDYPPKTEHRATLFQFTQLVRDATLQM